MPSPPSPALRVSSRRRWPLVGVFALGALVATPLRAHPVLAPRLIPDAIAGPADVHVAATFYNPAAIGYLRGIRLFVAGGPRATLGSAARDGQPREALGWADPRAFVGLTWDLGTESLSLGVAAYLPFTENSSYRLDGPLRYHEQYQRFFTVEETLAGAWQIERHVAIGAALIIDQSRLDIAYSRDLAPAGGSAVVDAPNPLCGGQPCGYENPLAEQSVRLRGYANGIGFSVGAMVRPHDRVWIGLSYTNHNAGGDIALLDVRRGRVTPAPGQGPVCGGAPCSGDNRVLTLLPEMVQSGLRVTVTPTLELAAGFRFVHYGAREALDVSLQGGSLARAQIPPVFAIDRGLQNSYAFELSSRHQVRPGLRLSPSLVYETSAVAPGAVSAAALEAPKLDAALTFEWTVWKSGSRLLSVGGHLGATAYLLRRVDSRFDAQAETACVDAAYDLDVCQKALDGAALPSASGLYTRVVLDAGVAIGFVYQP